MKKPYGKGLWFWCIIALTWRVLMSTSVMGNNVQITTRPILKAQSSSALICFSISWDHSWRINAYKNWDAVWVFAKFKDASGLWKSVHLSTVGHSVGANHGVTPTFKIGTSEIGGFPINMGVFMYRAQPGTGSISWENVSLQWNYSMQTATVLDQIKIEVFALEMVYIPQGNFYVGSGSTAETAAFKHTFDLLPYLIHSESPLLLSNDPTQTQALGTYGNVWTASGAEAVLNKELPATFPKGYQAFYVMKYELSQEAYKDFLNYLTPSQQSTRSGKTINDASAWTYLYNRDTYRNGLMLIKNQMGNLLFACNYYHEAPKEEMANRTSDGQNLPMNYLSLDDFLSYMDWAGLRPISELEYEKICRGPKFPSVNEYAWGNLFLQTCSDPRSTATDLGGGGEIPDKGNYNGSSVPLRVGAFAGSTTNRIGAGAGYYGCMELTSNVAERYININYLGAHSFLGESGDGELTTQGNCSPHLSWPKTSMYYM
ncbi:MAG: SUMF1/EgtB/PvdO family nonheme iron enzyme, partial [Bacteroidales bacterium]